MKRAFSMLEVVLAVVTMGVIGYLGFQKYMQTQFYSAVNKMNENIANILNNAVMDPVNGYVNGSGGDCSDDHTYKHLSAARAIDCRGWSEYYPWKGTKTTDGTRNYIYTLLRNYAGNGLGCKLYLGENRDDYSTFYVYLDCSNLNTPYSKYKAYIEKKVNAYLRDKFGTIVKETYFKATSIHSTSGGTESDGKVGFLFKK